MSAGATQPALPTASRSACAFAIASGLCAAAQREGGPLRWFHDDYAGALACARSKSLPLMIDMWAPWCHTCLSMQAYVLTDERLADYDRRYVFLALDTDREANAAIVARFPPAAWPTFFAVSSHDESIQSRFVGAATVEQFASFLDDGERGHQATGGAALAAHEAAARDGDRASAAKQWGAAIDAYATALAAAPTPWSRAPDVMVSLLSAHNRDKRWAACPQVVRDHLPKVGNAASASDFSAMALTCAEAQADAQADAKAATELREAVVAKLRALVDDRAAPLSVDDRSDALMYLREALDALGRSDEAREAAMRQRVMLDEAAGDAKDPRIAMTYNWPRAGVVVVEPPQRAALALRRRAGVDDGRRGRGRRLGLRGRRGAPRRGALGGGGRLGGACRERERHRERTWAEPGAHGLLLARRCGGRTPRRW